MVRFFSSPAKLFSLEIMGTEVLGSEMPLFPDPRSSRFRSDECGIIKPRSLTPGSVIRGSSCSQSVPKPQTTSQLGPAASFKGKWWGEYLVSTPQPPQAFFIPWTRVQSSWRPNPFSMRTWACRWGCPRFSTKKDAPLPFPIPLGLLRKPKCLVPGQDMKQDGNGVSSPLGVHRKPSLDRQKHHPWRI